MTNTEELLPQWRCINCKSVVSHATSPDRKAEKHDKAATNERFALLASQALARSVHASVYRNRLGDNFGLHKLDDDANRPSEHRQKGEE